MVARGGFRATFTTRGKVGQDRNLDPLVRIPVLGFLQRLIARKNADYEPQTVGCVVERLTDCRHYTTAAAGQQMHSRLRQPAAQS